ncbi:hypothetical protein [Tropicimonas sp. IMCC6043]|uniref:hypothetical protein n=1 Tax=Tropicimonas sp. IMCC6043 TaxID=2510645 RepID=UPI00101C7E51|nr:hypothetical protein [Tropicimonas sp. IMCC6043]RYH12413.1 hypothetical protein EU800_02325 [Tropicimonas sp. IMCC6043]
MTDTSSPSQGRRDIGGFVPTSTSAADTDDSPQQGRRDIGGFVPSKATFADADVFVFSESDVDAAYGGFGNDLLNADDVLRIAETTGDSEWRYVPVRRVTVETETDIAGNFRDTADGEIEVTDDPYSHFNFTVDFG